MKLEDWMRQKNLTDQAMSKLIDTSRTAVTMYRNGQRVPKPDIARRIFEVTNKKVTPSDFIL